MNGLTKSNKQSLTKQLILERREVRKMRSRFRDIWNHVDKYALSRSNTRLFATLMLVKCLCADFLLTRKQVAKIDARVKKECDAEWKKEKKEGQLNAITRNPHL